MPSTTLYPPIMNSYMPAFQVTAGSTSLLRDDTCPIDFSISKYNTPSEIKQIQISITKQSSGVNVLALEDTLDEETPVNSRYRSTGILLLDLPETGLTPSANNIYTVDLYDSDLDCSDGLGNEGFIPGWLYKVQMRFSYVRYLDERDTKTQAVWLKEKAQYFSEWSTICIVKPIGDMFLNVTNLISNNQPFSNDLTYPTSNLEIFGNIVSAQDETEVLYSYQAKLYDSNNILLEDSGTLIASNYNDINKIHYLFTNELQNNGVYGLEIKYVTNNNYSNTVSVNFTCEYEEGAGAGIYVTYLESTAAHNNIDTLTSLGFEEDEGRIGLLLNKDSEGTFTGKIFVRRTDSATNFTKWIDIKELDCTNTDISSLGLFYDYTVESGVWYKYAVQLLLPGETFRSPLIYPEDSQGQICDEDYAMRDFNYSFLLGENEQQLKLKFDNTMNSFKYQVTESKTETVGAKHPTIARNTAVYYRNFPVTSLISFQMDENQTFCKEGDILKWEKLRILYHKYKTDRKISQYDYIYEREFRDKVIEFLLNGKPKIFKSPTEGNIIVRLTDNNLIPNQSLGRMVYSFSANAIEIADNTLENQKKYKLINLYQLKNEKSMENMHIHEESDVNNSPDPPQNKRVW